MKQYFFLIVFLNVTSVALSQSGSDATKDPVKQFFTKSLIENLNKFPLNLNYYAIKDYTASSLYFKVEDGSYKDGRTPETIYDLGLQTEGIYRNKKNILFFGNITISKNYYKNLKWNLSYEMPEKGLMENPHYFGVSKGGDWNNQQYQLNGGVLIPLGNFTFLSKVEYQLFNKYRVDLDPRPEIVYNELNFNFGFSYNFSKKHHFKVSYLYGYTHVDNNINFSNKDQNNPSNYDIYVKWLSGYGSLSSPFKNSTQRRMSQHQTTLGYSFTFDKLTLMADFEYSKSDQVTYRNNGVIDLKDRSNYFATYEPVKIEGNILGLYQIDSFKTIKLNINGYSKKGDNFWEAKGGKSYSSSEENIAISIAYLKLYDKHKYLDLGVTTELWNIKQEDALAATILNYNNLDVESYVLRSFSLSNSLALSPFFKSMIRFNLNHLYSQGNKYDLENLEENDFAGYAQRDFYNEVVIPNSELYSSDQIKLSLGTLMQINSNKRFDLSLKIQAGTNFPLQKTKKFTVSNPCRFDGLFSLTISY